MKPASTQFPLTMNQAAHAVPPQAWFGVSAVFHYLGPSFAVLLFPSIGVLGVAWLRIVTAAALFAPFTHPLKTFRNASPSTRALLLALGLCLALMNCAFYLALDRLPMSLVAAMEFVGIIGVALYGARTWHNVSALALAAAGVFLLIGVIGSRDVPGLCWALLNAALFVVYIVLAHRAAENGAGDGVNTLGAAMAIALLVVMPIGITEALHTLASPTLLFAGIGVGICSSVVPYVCDQLAMSRLPRASFALLLALLPATATIIAAIVLAQTPSAKDVLGIVLVMLGVALHRSPRQLKPPKKLSTQ